MSVPDFIIITTNDDDQDLSGVVDIGQQGGIYLYEYLEPRIAKLDPEYHVIFKRAYTGADILSINGLPAKHWRVVCDMIMRACDELESLKPYKAQLKAALEADPRFKQAA